ncbi:conserved hypothetical protein [Verticillium alfalfae VaMs.102]|uniref:DUF6594 domain-containing protein n=1 Tax=Verticillium alfalfae (strain VaMs.102 / ATCC MYA-4576 / FGSC 10136) TaxID=526221 RepID=C9S9S5_VERA1|nr:conserved hypothetical protein [Verticillium alfalfae VaMs.102]EEY16138.1 conserved hypothetical protein [Verticillium alfalfae VaMs.102]
MSTYDLEAQLTGLGMTGVYHHNIGSAVTLQDELRELETLLYRLDERDREFPGMLRSREYCDKRSRTRKMLLHRTRRKWMDYGISRNAFVRYECRPLRVSSLESLSQGKIADLSRLLPSGCLGPSWVQGEVTPGRMGMIMGLQCVCTLLFGMVLAIFTNAKRHEIFTASATYMAILVVFMGQSPA